MVERVFSYILIQVAEERFAAAVTEVAQTQIVISAIHIILQNAGIIQGRVILPYILMAQEQSTRVPLMRL
jgi:hypothetical protein